MIITIVTIFLVLSILLTITILFLFIQLLWYKVPYVKTSQKVIDIIFENISISPEDKVYDIGCGDANLLIQIEKNLT